MTYSNEAKVGISIVLAVLIFVFGVRYFQDMPLFKGSYELVTEFDEVSGLVSGNPVMISGVNVGDVSRITLRESGREVQVRLRISQDVVIPEGSVVKQTGWSQLGGVQLVIDPGPSTNPRLQSGDFIPSQQTPGVLGNITEQAGPILTRMDTLLQQLDVTAEQFERQIGRSDSDVRRTLANLQAITASLDQIIRAEEENLDAILGNSRAITNDLRSFTENNSDDLAAGVTGFRTAVNRLDTTLITLDTTLQTYNHLGSSLDRVATSIEQGDGTLGQLSEDPRLYHRVDSLVNNLNLLIVDLRENPRRYLRHIRGIDLF
jgi:phospholipid/cholesterol/gamma-HCH transport system substrate-binding protein